MNQRASEFFQSKIRAIDGVFQRAGALPRIPAGLRPGPDQGATPPGPVQGFRPMTQPGGLRPPGPLHLFEGRWRSAL
jgi:hypothetical protein